MKLCLRTFALPFVPNLPAAVCCLPAFFLDSLGSDSLAFFFFANRLLVRPALQLCPIFPPAAVVHFRSRSTTSFPRLGVASVPYRLNCLSSQSPSPPNWTLVTRVLFLMRRSEPGHLSTPTSRRRFSDRPLFQFSFLRLSLQLSL